MTHVVAVEYQHGVVLIDSGLGRADVVSPGLRLGRAVFTLRPALSEAETAGRQLQALGFSADDVTDIVATHLDYDHVGGVSDFPSATLHVTGTEYTAAAEPKSRKEKARYRRAHLESLTSVETYDTPTSEVLGLATHQLDDAGELHLIPLPGHTNGHAAVAFHDPIRRGWLVHAGDGAMHRSSIDAPATTPRAFRAAEQLLAMDRSRLNNNHRLLGDLHRQGARVFCSHDAVQLQALRAD